MDIRKVISKYNKTMAEVASQMKKRKSHKDDKEGCGKGSIGISAAALGQMIDGDPQIGRLMEIADILGCSIHELIGDETDGDGEMRCPHCGKPIKVELSKVQ